MNHPENSFYSDDAIEQRRHGQAGRHPLPSTVPKFSPTMQHRYIRYDAIST